MESNETTLAKAAPEDVRKTVAVAILSTFIKPDPAAPLHPCNALELLGNCITIRPDVFNGEEGFRALLMSLVDAGLVVAEPGRTATEPLGAINLGISPWFASLILHVFSRRPLDERQEIPTVEAVERRIKFIVNRAYVAKQGRLECRICRTLHGGEKALQRHITNMHWDEVQGLASAVFE